ncbi:MAG: GNAT family N-acetyltransferase [Candidatus Lokiarchaeota archaeon]|nr:GNAT family N-acetyltransferase [Candidatus Lokiarchaeota archaeon]MBD3201352.1 GNAT family N-acetyltransferase [Candidatus Lokiarchaeota archaeon]
MGTDKESNIRSFGINFPDTNFVIRRCTANDLDGVIEVNERELPEDYPYFFYKSILDNYSDSFLIACEKENPNKIIGYIMWRIERTPSVNSLELVNKGHLVSIAILEQYRRKGVASALLMNSMPAIEKHNISEFVLEVRVSNYPAINLYKKFRYKINTIKKQYYRDGENAYYMIKKVSK